MFVFAHNPKTAGTTFRFILRRNFGERYLDIYTPLLRKLFGVDRVTPVTRLLSNKELIHVINQYGNIECMGSHSFRFPNSFADFLIMIFLRDPVERVLSEYFYFRNKYLDCDELPGHIRDSAV